MKNVIPFPYQDQVARFNVDGWINATDIAKKHGKLPNEWLRLPETRRYMDALAKALNAGESRNLIRTSRGRSGGTWLHPKLAVVFARWIDAEFAVWCDLRIDALLRGDMNAMQRYEQACQQLDDQIAKGSMAGRELAAHRWQKPLLEARAEYWRDQLQMSLPMIERQA